MALVEQDQLTQWQKEKKRTKGQTIIYTTSLRKLKIAQHEPK
jgi:hypothetical protein